MQVQSFRIDRVIMSLICAFGIALAGYFIGNSFIKARMLDRYVTVKGLAETEVTSDLAIWPINIKATGNNLSEVNDKIESDRKLVIDFLLKQGFQRDEIEIGNYVVNDLLAQAYRNSNSEDFRYIINASVILKTRNIELVKKASISQSQLVQQGIVLGGEGYSDTGPSYEFTKFNDIKPEMLAEAIQNARKSAEKFAQDSGSKLGYLRKANQGMFLISPVDVESSEEYNNAQAAKKSIRKKIRVVTTLEYSIKD